MPLSDLRETAQRQWEVSARRKFWNLGSPFLQELNEGRRSPRSDAQIIKVVFVASENFSTLPSQKCNPTR
jgi:hypothetical protein